MKKQNRETRLSEARRRFLRLLGGAAAAGLSLSLLPRRKGPDERELREADFYRSHDLAG
jgi:hypothetical protein